MTTRAPSSRAATADVRPALAVAVGGILLVVAAWIVPARGDVTWSGVAAVTVFGALSCAVACGVLLPRWSRLEPPSKARRALATSLATLLTIPLLWLLAVPFAVLTATALLGRAAHGDGQRAGAVAAVVSTIGLLCSALLAVLGMLDVLPDWPPRDWHGGGG